MPEFRGYRVRDGKLVAVVRFPKARRFKLVAPESPQVRDEKETSHEEKQ